MQAPILGLWGDFLTLIGGLLLAIDAVKKEREFTEIKDIAEKRGQPLLAQIKFSMEGVEIADENEVNRAFLRRSARVAKWGCIVLVAGFAFLVIARLAELTN